jgi:FkbM family methyltransferase
VGLSKLPKTWLMRATQLRFRYPKIEPLLDWCLDFALRGRDSVIQRGFAQVEVRCEALGSSDAQEEFILSAKSQWGKLASAGPPPAGAVRRITVALRSLDALVSAGAVAPPDLMKIDVEGSRGRRAERRR